MAFLFSIIALVVALGTALLPYNQIVTQYTLSARLLLLGLVLAFVAILLSALT